MNVKSVCPHDCPDTCAMLVTVENGRAIRMAGDPHHPVTQGFLCTKVAKYLERTYHEGRLLYPQIRTGAKGEGKRNFELGFVTEDFDVVDRATALFESVWSGAECRSCGLVKLCPDPILPPSAQRAPGRPSGVRLGKARRLRR